MNRKKSIRLKAVFLLIVFSLNTIIGFACAVGINMGFNAHHHNGDETTISNTSHHHNAFQHNDHHKSKNSKDNCCNDQVMKFSQLDKSVPQSLNFTNPIFITSFISAYYSVDIFNTSYQTASIKYFVRSHHPPIPDIRIEIQSFQI